MLKIKNGNLILALLKLPLFTVAFLLSLLYYLFSMILPMPKMHRFFLRFSSYPFFRLILFLCGNFSIPEMSVPLVDTFEGSSVENEDVGPGDIIISHFSSFLDLFWLHYKYSPIFAVPNKDQKTVTVFSIYTCLQLFANQIPAGKVLKLENVVKAGRKWLCPIVIFPEGILKENTNRISNFMMFGRNSNCENVKFHIIGFDHQIRKRDNFIFEDINSFLGLLMLLGNVLSRMKVKYALSQDIPRLNNNEIDELFLNKCKFVLSTISRINVEHKIFESNIEETNKIHKD